MELQQTPLSEWHAANGARMVDFSGWSMPVQYAEGILAEHQATRERVGLFDTCHMGEFVFTGDDVRDALAHVLAGDFAKVKDGRERYTFLTRDDGGIIDDAVVMFRSAREAILVVNAGDIERKFDWIRQKLPAGVTADNRSAATAKLDVQGPAAHAVVEAVTAVDFRGMPFYSFVETQWQGQPLTVSRSGYTGEPGAELYIAADAAVPLWEALLRAGEPHGLAPCGLGARDTLRLEAGLPLYGHEMDESTHPFVLGADRFVSLDKPQPFPGKEALRAVRETREGDPAAPVLVGLRCAGKRVPRPHFAVIDGDETVGEVTSGGPGPTVGVPVALAHVRADRAEAGRALAIQIRKKSESATVAELPFYANAALRKRSG